MKKLSIYIAVFGILLSFPVLAQVHIKPHHHEAGKVNVFAPHYRIVPDRSKIYTPDRYSCTMRRNLRYCVNRKGRAINGQIVTTDGQTVTYATYLNGYQSGETSVYSNDGNLIERAIFKKGLRDGEAIEYYINGNVWLIKHYDKGLLNGKVDEYDISGVLIGQMTYKKGWLKDAYCANEKPGYTMSERVKNTKFNQIIPCNRQNDDELM